MAINNLDIEDVERIIKAHLKQDIIEIELSPKSQQKGAITFRINCTNDQRENFFTKIETYCRQNNIEYKRHKEKLLGCSIGGAYVSGVVVILKGNKRGNGTQHEDRNVDSINNQLMDIMQREKTDFVKLKIGNEFFEIYSCKKFVGTDKNKYNLHYDPKCDFYFRDIKETPIVFVSHKDGNSSKSFQNWAGISETAQPKIARNPLTKKFCEALKLRYPEGMQQGDRAVAMNIPDNDILAMLAVYGEEYGSQKSWNNVHIVIQGDVRLVKNGDYYTIQANEVLINGQAPKGGYKPVFMARYMGDRNNVVNKCRAGIFPKDYRSDPKWIE